MSSVCLEYWFSMLQSSRKMFFRQINIQCWFITYIWILWPIQRNTASNLYKWYFIAQIFDDLLRFNKVCTISLYLKYQLIYAMGMKFDLAYIFINTTSEKAGTSSVNRTSRYQCPCKSAIVYVDLVYRNNYLESIRNVSSI